MPDESPPSNTTSEKEIPDLVGEELGDYAHIWREYDRVTKDDDRERIGNWNRGLDNLALFAGLFSAVTTAFIIESQHDTQPDWSRLTFLVLNATAASQPFVQEPFVIDGMVRTINCLWISSLLLSLTAALIAIMGKDWIGIVIIVIAGRYWHHIEHNRLEVLKLENEVRRRLSAAHERRYVEMIYTHFGGRSGFVELLSFLINDLSDEALRPACDIIASLLHSEWAAGIADGTHTCLAYVYGYHSPRIIEAAWTARRWTFLSLVHFAEALPLFQYRHFTRNNSVRLPSLDNRDFEPALALCVVRMLSPEHPLVYLRRPARDGQDTDLSHTEICIRCLNALLRYLRDSGHPAQSDVVSLILESTALLGATRVPEDRSFSIPTTTERAFINILTMIARFLGDMLGSCDTFTTGVRLFCLFSSSDAKDSEGETDSWDLGAYTRQRLAHPPDDEPSTAASMRRLVLALSDLHPFCGSRDEFRDAWEHIGLSEEHYDNYPSWDYSLADFFDVTETPAPAETGLCPIAVSHERVMTCAVTSMGYLGSDPLRELAWCTSFIVRNWFAFMSEIVLLYGWINMSPHQFVPEFYIPLPLFARRPGDIIVASA
ncbi:hypothetical protein AURDEDRAFT_188283 [Auricularia subglabra TFB-10046 SS5]|nr:hypothetical protein AURDEDRAFT_188283 [Auricularia subglabra TFB-10046 SS5]